MRRPSCMTHYLTLPLPDYTLSQVVIAGDIMLDRYWYGTTSRISPESPVPIVHVDGSEDRAGGAGNVAMNVAALGGRTALLGYVGADNAGRRLRELLEAQGCEVALQDLPNHITITRHRVISHQQQLIRLDFEQQPTVLPTTGLRDKLNNLLANAGVLLLSDYAKGTMSNPQPLINSARAREIPIVVDTKHQDFLAYRGATVLTLNLRKFFHAVGECPDEATIITRGQNILKDLDLRALLLIRGEEGVTLLRRDKSPLYLPTNAREVFDTTGAGDSVVAVLATAIAAGQSIEQAAWLASIAAGIVGGKVGTATVSYAELEIELGVQTTIPHGVVSEIQLLKLVHMARRRGERLVMTNGCFDLIHPGHVACIERASRLGDRLIVAVNSDDSVRRLKGTQRPVNPLAHRMAVLAALRAVDWVVDFPEDTPERLICAVRPDILVKGGDYHPDEIAGAACVRANGGDVRIVPVFENYSTTRIIDKLR